jgi:hypothetical protein
MFCRTGPPSERSSALSAYRPSSRDSQSEVSNVSNISNPTSMSSVEATPTKKSLTKTTSNAPSTSGDEKSPRKKSAFFSNSPFRRKSRHDKERPVIAAQQAISPQPVSSSHSMPRGGWDSSIKQMSPTKQMSPPKQVVSPPKQASPTKQVSPVRPSAVPPSHRSGSPEPVDPRANFQLNVGNNVFDVASPEQNSPKKGAQSGQAPEDELDPIARALADLKTSGKQSASRVSADRYHGISTPTPSAPSSAYEGRNAGAAAAAAPPPAYNDPSVKRLGAPQPAFTAKQMHKTTQKYTGQTQSMLRGQNNSMGSTHSGQSQETPRARSPAPRRSVSPQVASPRVDTRMSQNSGRGPSPSPSTYQSNSMRSQYSQSPTPRRAQEPPYSPNDFARRPSPSVSHRAVSPQPQFRQQVRPSSAGGMELQVSGSHDMYGSPGGYAGSTRGSSRPSSTYGDGPPIGRSRSRTLAVADPGRKFSRDGRPVLHFGKNPSRSLTMRCQYLT